MATPASAAPNTGAALSPHEKALRLPPSRLLLRFVLPRLDVRSVWRLWVRVAIELLLGVVCWWNGRRRGAVPIVDLPQPPLGASARGRSRVPPAVPGVVLLRTGSGLRPEAFRAPGLARWWPVPTCPRLRSAAAAWRFHTPRPAVAALSS